MFESTPATRRALVHHAAHERRGAVEEMHSGSGSVIPRAPVPSAWWGTDGEDIDEEGEPAAEKRQYIRLRRITDDILVKIRYLNQIAISVHGGLLDEEGARQEIELTERQLHECVDRLRHNAGLTG